MGKKTLFLIILAILVLGGLPSCYIINFSKEIDFTISYTVLSDTSNLHEEFLVDLSDNLQFKAYDQYIESMEIQAITCYLSDFTGSPEQKMSNGILQIADENGEGIIILSRLPDEALEALYLHEMEIESEPDGINRVEDLLLNSPNKCLSIFSADIKDAPANFTIKFQIKAIIHGSLI